MSCAGSSRSKIAAFKVPVEIQIQRDPLPRNANGKIMKNELRGRFTPRGVAPGRFTPRS